MEVRREHRSRNSSHDNNRFSTVNQPPHALACSIPRVQEFRMFWKNGSPSVVFQNSMIIEEYTRYFKISPWYKAKLFSAISRVDYAMHVRAHYKPLSTEHKLGTRSTSPPLTCQISVSGGIQTYDIWDFKGRFIMIEKSKWVIVFPGVLTASKECIAALTLLGLPLWKSWDSLELEFN